jgi:type I restriction enzyme S subunit
VPESFETYQLVEPGNIIVRPTDLQNDQVSLRVGIARDHGIITSAYMCLKARESVNPEYAFRVLQAYDLLKIIYGFGSGPRQNLDFRDIKRMPVPVPSLEEQDAIVRYLDYMDRRIRRYIAAKQRLIKLLEEQKQGIIQQAVTRGLAPSVRLKPSGVEWLGDIPEHWEAKPARYLFRAVTRRDAEPSDPKLSVTQKKGLLPTELMAESSTQAANYERFQVCHIGDLVLNKYKAHLGVFWAAELRGLITPNYTVFRSSTPSSTKYFELLFHTKLYREELSRLVYGVTEGMSPLYTQDFYGLRTLFPPLSEQEEIIKYLHDETATQNRTIERVEQQIALMREYRTCLIADVVTGKLDVRGVELPDESYDEGIEDVEIEDAALDEMIGKAIEEEGAVAD